ncbi:MAG: hypothetical protein IBJ13_08125 [Sphingopyxis sp.]|nr:hypothetical protein [Sphingopyxis sp.]
MTYGHYVSDISALQSPREICLPPDDDPAFYEFLPDWIGRPGIRANALAINGKSRDRQAFCAGKRSPQGAPTPRVSEIFSLLEDSPPAETEIAESAHR